MLTLQSATEQLPSLKKSAQAAYQVNLACERLVSMGKFKGMLDALAVKVYEDNRITLPGAYETVIGAARDGYASPVRDPWYQFTPRPNAYILPDPDFYSADLGDSFVTYRSVSGATGLRAVLEDPADESVAAEVKVRRAEDEGVLAEVDTFSGTLGDLADEKLSGAIDAVTRFIKGRTAGTVSLEANFGGIWTEVGRFGPRDTEICLRSYSVPGAAAGDVVTVYAKRRFRPAEEPSDELPVESIYALRCALEALAYEADGDVGKADNFWTLARRAMSDALSEHRGAAIRTVPVYCRASAGAKLRAIR